MEEILVEVYGIAGEKLEAKMGLQSMAEELSLVIAEQWKMPPLCQKLVVDEQVLAPPSPLAGYAVVCDGCHVLKVSLVVTLEEVQRMLEDSNYERRVIALVEVLGKLGQRGGRAAVDVVLPQLDDSNENIQMFAAETLGKVALPGDRDRDVVEKLTMLLEWASWGCKCAALESCASLALRPYDEVVVTAAAACLEDAHDSVRLRALRTLEQVSTRGDERVVVVISDRIRHENEDVRRAAIRALASLGARGDMQLIDLLCNCLEDDEHNPRHAVGKALREIAGQSHPGALEGVLSRLRHHDKHVRYAAVEALRYIASSSDEEALKALAAIQVNDSCDAVKCRAYLSLQEILA